MRGSWISSGVYLNAGIWGLGRVKDFEGLIKGQSGRIREIKRVAVATLRKSQKSRVNSDYGGFVLLKWNFTSACNTEHIRQTAEEAREESWWIFTTKTTCSLLVLFRSCWATFCSARAKMWGEGKISICPSAGPSVASSHIPHVLAAQRFNLFTTPVTTRSTCTWRIKWFRNNSDYWAIVEVIIWANFQTTRLSRLLEYEAFYAIYNNCIKLSWISLQ